MTEDRECNRGRASWFNNLRDTRRKRRVARRVRRRQLLLEPLETRAMLAVVSLSPLGDQGATGAENGMGPIYVDLYTAKHNVNTLEKQTSPV